MKRLQGARNDLSDSVQWYLPLLLIGAGAIGWLVAAGGKDPDPGSSWIFLRMVSLGELPQVAIQLLFTSAVVVVARRGNIAGLEWGDSVLARPHCLVAILFTTIMLAIAVGTGILGASPFSMDEYVMRFQSRVFLSGRMFASPPALPGGLVDAARPLFVFPTLEGDGWISGYLPTFSLLLAPFELLNVSWLLNPLLNGVSVWAVFALARTQWPKEPEMPLVAVLVLATSSQFIAAAGTTYAMSAHLATGLLWLLCVRSSGRAWLAAGPLSLIASTLHQPVPHFLFAAPFLVRMVRERQFGRLAYLAPWYIGAACVLVYWSGQMSGRFPTFGAQGILYWPSTANVIVLLLNLVLSMTWNSPIATLLVVFAVRSWRRITPFEKDLLLGIGGSLAFYLFFRLQTQGHGWGWRYGHHVLGSIALASASGWSALSRAVGLQAAVRLAMLSLALTVFAQWPLRATMMWRLSSPFARAHTWLQRQDAVVIEVPVDSIWYGRDLIRNEWNLRSPIIVPAGRITDSIRDSLQRIHPGRILTVTVSELEALGLERVNPDERR